MINRLKYHVSLVDNGQKLEVKTLFKDNNEHMWVALVVYMNANPPRTCEYISNGIDFKLIDDVIKFPMTTRGLNIAMRNRLKRECAAAVFVGNPRLPPEIWKQIYEYLWGLKDPRKYTKKA